MDVQSFAAHQSQFTQGLAVLVREPANCITITRAVNIAIAASGQRRLMAARSLLSDSQLLAIVNISTANATQVFMKRTMSVPPPHAG